ncbi:MAG: 3-oxoacyl-[acyl-carrier-protein] reductase [Chloroflexota bacterium]|nr:MAG: 3-oxoacyl-[acyl-carrier-protein] reductase [Chloroflexota bacterium]
MSLPSSLSLEGRVAVVTGSSRGIGRTVAKELAQRGASVVVNYHKSTEEAEEVVQEIRTAGGKAESFQADVSNFTEAQDLIKFAIDTFQGLDILVNNAGITRDNLIMMMTEGDWDIVQTTNLKSAFNCSKPAVRYMMRKRYGRIINITSIAGQMGNPGQTNYSASKAGQIGFTKALAREVGSRNITVNAIAAGYVETDIWNNVPNEAKEAILAMVPLGRKGTTQEIADAVAFLASDQAAYITGQVIGIDGGMTMM